MQHYQFHIGDYVKDTAHLTDLEDLAYRRLLDLYYDTEGHIPADPTQIARRIRSNVDAVTQVLSEFFYKTDSGEWKHHRCDQEIEKVYEKSEKARANAAASHAVRRAKATPENSERNADAQQTHSERNANALLPVTRNPLPVTRYPLPVTQDVEPVSTLESEQSKSKPLQPAKPAAAKKPDLTADETALQAVCRETWGRYSEAYTLRYGTAPVRNPKINGQVKQFCQRIPRAEAPAIAAFFVRHNAAFYVSKGHAIGMLLSDAEKLRTEWVTNSTITATQAQQADKTQANGNTWNKVLSGIEERDRNAAIN